MNISYRVITHFVRTKLPLTLLLIQATQTTSIISLNVQCNLHVPTFRRKLYYSCT